MSLNKHDLSKLKKIIALAEKMITNEREKAAKQKLAARPKRIRRSGKELVAFRKMLKAERKNGASVLDLAKKHGVSTAYIYTL